MKWIVGDATTLPELHVDLALMTGNVAQVFIDETSWNRALRGIRSALLPKGAFVFEARDPTKRAWHEWNRDKSFRRTDIPGVGYVQEWVEVTREALPLISFRWTFIFEADNKTITSDSTLRFQTRDELESSLKANGFEVLDARDAPDRPGKEMVFVTRAN